MGRRKQLKPHRSVGISKRSENAEVNQNVAEDTQGNKDIDLEKPIFVEVDKSGWNSTDHYDISEVSLTNLSFSREFSCDGTDERSHLDSRSSLKFKLCNANSYISRMKLGHWPVLPANDIYLEFTEMCMSEDGVLGSLVVSGNFDGPDGGVTGLVHLTSLKFLTLRPVMGFVFSEQVSSLRVRVEILRSAFDASESILDTSRQFWRKSMMGVMGWLRPDIMTSEARYGRSESPELESSSQMEVESDSSIARKHTRFDAARFYEAIKPSKEDPMLEDDIPGLLPELRPYQRRAAYWMVQREKGAYECSSESAEGQLLSPLCLPVHLVDTCSTIFYNPFSGSVSLHPECSSSYVFGGILADEMGLGKTVELLACIFSHKKSEPGDRSSTDGIMKVIEDHKMNLKRLKRERVECICGSTSESYRYKGLWVQCDICDAWQHADCVGYSTNEENSEPRDTSKGQGCKSKVTENSRKRSRKHHTEIVTTEKDYICQLCSELIEATDAPIATGATLIVCPATILAQWHAEITRHTNPGSLRTCIYEGVRNSSLCNTSQVDMRELIGADIVLTTYDTLKEDLSHDCDRHEGDRRFMRFHKRYPVIPTLLTRIFWWRICLDEAQMVESNAAAATEMAIRLHGRNRWCITGTAIQRKLDDLYGLLRFLKASPFDVHRWWIEVLRDPYEKGDAGAIRYTHRFFKKIMWRSSKANVAEELLLPPQDECLTWLSFSPIEEHFYQRQHETCVSYAHELIESFRDDSLKHKIPGSALADPVADAFITHVEASKLLNSLLKLRQACCHPQVGSSGLRSLQRSPMTMDEILSVLVGKTKVEGEEALRKSVVALNGLAGISIIKQEFSEAASLYREALALAKEHAENFRLDPLLNIHIHHNLAEILPLLPDYSQQSLDMQIPERTKDCDSRFCNVKERDQYDGEKGKGNGKGSSNSNIDAKHSSECTFDSQYELSGDGEEHEINTCLHPSFPTYGCLRCLRIICQNLKQKFLSAFTSRLLLAQQEFRKSHMQVCDAFNDRKNQHAAWWLEALHHVELDRDSSNELIKKIGDAVAGTLNVSRTSKIASWLVLFDSCLRSWSGIIVQFQAQIHTQRTQENADILTMSLLRKQIEGFLHRVL